MKGLRGGIACAFFLLMSIFTSLCGAATLLRPGDVLDIVVKEHPELSRMVLVKADGTIDYPFLEDRSVAGMTPSEVGELLTYRMAKSVGAPFVLVMKTDKLPMKIRVLGQVVKPGVLPMTIGATLQEVLLAAGGATESADLAQVKILRENATDIDALRVNYKVFLETGDLSVLPEIRNGDTVILLAAPRDRKVKVLGAVANPGYYIIQGETNLFDIIYLAGGPGDKANLSKIRHILSTEGKVVDAVVDLQEYIDQGKMDDIPKVREGETIIVYRKFITWGMFLNGIRDALMLLMAYRVFAGG